MRVSARLTRVGPEHPRRSERQRDPQLPLGLVVASELAQQLAVVLADAGPIGIELERPREGVRGDDEAAVAVGHRRERAEREGIARIDPRDLLHILERAPAGPRLAPRWPPAAGRRARRGSADRAAADRRAGRCHPSRRCSRGCAAALPVPASRHWAAPDRPAAPAAAAPAAARYSCVARGRAQPSPDRGLRSGSRARLYSSGSAPIISFQSSLTEPRSTAQWQFRRPNRLSP